MTKLNQKILQLIQESSGHLNATEVFLLAREKGIDVSLSSTYRILNSLYEKGYISKFVAEDKVEVYDKTLSDHSHLICEKCGKINDIHLSDFKKILCDKLNYDITGYRLNITYICEECQRKKEGN